MEKHFSIRAGYSCGVRPEPRWSSRCRPFAAAARFWYPAEQSRAEQRAAPRPFCLRFTERYFSGGLQSRADLYRPQWAEKTRAGVTAHPLVPRLAWLYQSRDGGHTVLVCRVNELLVSAVPHRTAPHRTAPYCTVQYRTISCGLTADGPRNREKRVQLHARGRLTDSCSARCVLRAALGPCQHRLSRNPQPQRQELSSPHLLALVSLPSHPLALVSLPSHLPNLVGDKPSPQTSSARCQPSTNSFTSQPCRGHPLQNGKLQKAPAPAPSSLSLFLFSTSPASQHVSPSLDYAPRPSPSLQQQQQQQKKKKLLTRP